MKILLVVAGLALACSSAAEDLDKHNRQTGRLSDDWTVETHTNGALYPASEPIGLGFHITTQKKGNKLPTKDLKLKISLVDQSKKEAFSTKLTVSLSMIEKDGFFSYDGKISNVFPNPQDVRRLSLVNVPGRYSLLISVEVSPDLKCEFSSAKIEVRRY